MATSADNVPPSSDIALCFSGGGYRAAAYHLGTLTMLFELGMLDRVKYFSTASGGTIVAMAYVLSRLDEKKGNGTKYDFEEFSTVFQKFLLDNNVVNKALANITKEHFPAQKNDMSLIRAAAGLYEETLTTGKTIKDLKDHAIASGKFRDLIFNVTEFHSGLGFRFRVTNGERRTFGNQTFNVTDRALQNSIKLSDVVAASSCFPGAFEPMRFPDDFNLPDSEREKLPFSDAADGCRSLPLMDGGIFDNQGVAGLVASYENREEKAGEPVIPFDFVVISDTTQKAEPLLDYKIAERTSGKSINSVFQIVVFALTIVFTSSLVLIGFALANFKSDTIFQTVATELAAIFSLLVSGALLFLLAFVRYELTSLNVLGTRFPIWQLIRELNFGDLTSLISTRLQSVQIMTFNIFMKRIRDLSNKTVLTATSKTTHRNLLFGKNCYSLIYDIEKGTEVSKLRNLDPKIDVNRRMVRISKAAGEVPTALWLNEEQVKMLVECGRVTACHSMLRLVWDKWRRANKDAQIPGLVPKDNEEVLELVKKPTNPRSPFYQEYIHLRDKWLKLKDEKVPDVLLP